MLKTLNSFQCNQNISEELKEKIKLFYVFDDQNGYNVLFITNDDQVYSFGQNSFGCCGLGHNSAVEEPAIIHELCGKNIKIFCNGYDFVIGLNSDGQLYSFGRSMCGQLGINTKLGLDDYLKPSLVNIPENERIVEISCGAFHCLALTSHGFVYGWGNNQLGQVGCGQLREDMCLHPVKLEKLSEIVIRSIHCSIQLSFALTNDGQVYGWGPNYHCALGLRSQQDEATFEPELIDISNVKNMCSTGRTTYFLTMDGLLYFCGNFKINDKEIIQQIPQLMECELNFFWIRSVPSYQKKGVGYATGVANDLVYKFNYNVIEKTDYKSVLEYYSNESKMTFETVGSEKENNHDNNFLLNNNKAFFLDLDTIGKGGFGQVTKVKSRIDKQFYAIKEIKCDDFDQVILMREVNTLTRVKGDCVVQYFDSWIENNRLYIQMELCSDNLSNIIEQKVLLFDKELFDETISVSLEELTLIEYFISTEIFKDTLECVQYLHGLNPPIIHRDIKPENFLVNETPKKGEFIKICDFGLAVEDGLVTLSHTQDQGTTKYMAPEVKEGINQRSKYNTKVDVYSLALIAEEVFGLDIDRVEDYLDHSELKEKMKLLDNQIQTMSRHKYKERPTCAQVLSNSNEWTADVNIIKAINNLDLFINSLSNDFLKNYFQFKISKL